MDFTPEERQPIFEAAWAKGGFYMGLETFSDYLVNKESNDTVSEFIRGKIREMVNGSGRRRSCWRRRTTRSSPSGRRWRTATTRASTGTT